MIRVLASGFKLGLKLGIPVGALIALAAMGLAMFTSPNEDDYNEEG